MSLASSVVLKRANNKKDFKFCADIHGSHTINPTEFDATSSPKDFGDGLIFLLLHLWL